MVNAAQTATAIERPHHEMESSVENHDMYSIRDARLPVPPFDDGSSSHRKRFQPTPWPATLRWVQRTAFPVVVGFALFLAWWLLGQ